MSGACAMPAAWSVFSTFTTVSAPCGIGAPVMMRQACPRSRRLSRVSPAGMSPATGRVHGPSPSRSSPRTANPSIAEFVKGGRGISEETSTARRRPRHSSTGSVSWGRTWLSASASISSRCCAVDRAGSCMCPSVGLGGVGEACGGMCAHGVVGLLFGRLGVAVCLASAARGVGRVGRLQLVSAARIWNAGGNCTTWRFDTPATRRWKASCSAKPPRAGDDVGLRWRRGDSR